jgi:hypothetical protein
MNERAPASMSFPTSVLHQAAPNNSFKPTALSVPLIKNLPHVADFFPAG